MEYLTRNPMEFKDPQLPLLIINFNFFSLELIFKNLDDCLTLKLPVGMIPRDEELPLLVTACLSEFLHGTRVESNSEKQ